MFGLVRIRLELVKIGRKKCRERFTGFLSMYPKSLLLLSVSLVSVKFRRTVDDWHDCINMIEFNLFVEKIIFKSDENCIIHIIRTGEVDHDTEQSGG